MLTTDADIQFLATVNATVADYEREAADISTNVTKLEKKIAELKKRYSVADQVIDEHKKLTKEISSLKSANIKQRAQLSGAERRLEKALKKIEDHEADLSKAREDERLKAETEMAKIQKMVGTTIRWLLGEGVSNFMDFSQSKAVVDLIRDYKAGEIPSLDAEEAEALEVMANHRDSESNLNNMFNTLVRCLCVQSMPKILGFAHMDLMRVLPRFALFFKREVLETMLRSLPWIPETRQ